MPGAAPTHCRRTVYLIWELRRSSHHPWHAPWAPLQLLHLAPASGLPRKGPILASCARSSGPSGRAAPTCNLPTSGAFKYACPSRPHGNWVGARVQGRHRSVGDDDRDFRARGDGQGACQGKNGRGRVGSATGRYMPSCQAAATAAHICKAIGTLAALRRGRMALAIPRPWRTCPWSGSSCHPRPGCPCVSSSAALSPPALG